MTAPNGGENLTIGDRQTSHWTLADGARAWARSTSEAVSPTQGHAQAQRKPRSPSTRRRPATRYSWNVTPPPATDYRLRLVYNDGAGNEITRDESDTDFTVGVAGHRLTLTVTAPNGGEQLGTGTPTTATWTLSEAVPVGSFDVYAREHQPRRRRPAQQQPDRRRPGEDRLQLRLDGDADAGEPTTSCTSSTATTTARRPSTTARTPSSRSTRRTPCDLVAVGKYEYVADGLSGLKIYDISNPSAPTLVGACDTPGNAQGVVVKGDYAYVADGAPGMQVVDVNDPAHPAIVKTLATLAGAPAPVAVGRRRPRGLRQRPAGWTVTNGTMSVDTDHVKHGAASLKVAAAPGTTAQIVADTNWDLSRENQQHPDVGLPAQHGHVAGLGQQQPQSQSLAVERTTLSNFFCALHCVNVHEGWNLLHWAPGGRRRSRLDRRTPAVRPVGTSRSADGAPGRGARRSGLRGLVRRLPRGRRPASSRPSCGPSTTATRRTTRTSSPTCSRTARRRRCS